MRLIGSSKFPGIKGIGRLGRKGQGKWGLPAGGEGLKGRICQRLYFSLLASWCNIREEILVGDLNGSPCNCQGWQITVFLI